MRSLSADGPTNGLVMFYSKTRELNKRSRPGFLREADSAKEENDSQCEPYKCLCLS